MLLNQLEPSLSIHVIERLDVAAAESSGAWQNAGTGHSAFCELNYTPELPDRTVETSKAVDIAEAFEVSKQFLSYLVKQNLVCSLDQFIRSIPHMSFVWENENLNFLRNRLAKLTECHLFKDMAYSDDPIQLKEWMPLVIEGRAPEESVAATKMDLGTDVNFGSLTRMMFNALKEMDQVKMNFNLEVKDLKQEDGVWEIKVKDLEVGDKTILKAKFVFIGAGGGSLPLLEKSDISEGKSYGGFPVSGQWLKCINLDVVEKHNAKVYGKAADGSPPMSVPLLDTRMIEGKKHYFLIPMLVFLPDF